MKTYQKVEVNQIEAAQYGKDEEVKQHIEVCVLNDKGEVKSANNGFLGIPKNPFTGIKTSTGYKRITHGDWLVKKGEELFVVPNDIFQLMFAEV